jgi:dTDP-4-dehydrorhamnose reductase
MVLLLGATGYLGQAFAAELRKRELQFTPLTRKALDYTRLDVLFNYVRATKPAFVINAAGYTGRPNIDACETARAEAVQANTLLPQTVARACYLTKTPWGHVSSGCIYSGAVIERNGSRQIERNLNRPEIRRLFDTQPERFGGFVESDEPNFTFRSPPCSFYSGTKALAEEALRWFDQGYLWRPRLIFDEFDHPRNLLSRIQRYPRVHDTVNSLSHRGDFVCACLDLWERGAPFGTYNVVNPGAVTGRQLVEMIRNTIRPDRPFEFWNSDEEFYRFAAMAPRSNCLLDCAKLLSPGVRMRPVGEALEDSLAKWQSPAQTEEWMQDFLKVPATQRGVSA